VAYWLLGYGFSVSDDVDNGFIGNEEFGGENWEGTTRYGQAFVYALMGVSTQFIVNGAISERAHFHVYLLQAFVNLVFIWPVIVAWGWGGGWLTDIDNSDFIDYGGSGTIHLFAGAAALAGLLAVKPRLHRYEDQQKVPAFIESNNIRFTFGTMLYMVALCVQNGARANNFQESAAAFWNTWLAGSFCGLLSTFLLTIKSRSVSRHFTGICRGTIAGMVAVAACANNAEGWDAFVIGVATAPLFAFSVVFIEWMKLDDVDHVIATHMIPGMAGLFAAGLHDNEEGGYHGANGKTLGVQILAIVVIFVWSFVLNGIFYLVLIAAKMISDDKDVQTQGTDQAEIRWSGFKVNFRSHETEMPQVN
jgi:Amt family ammonium transporter